MYDLIIIGGGPAGMTAAVYAARKQVKGLVITKDFGGQVLWTAEIENYMGYQFITGPELMTKFEEQLKDLPIAIKYEEVTELTRNADGTFTVKGEAGCYQGKTVIIASGKRPKRLGVPGEETFTGRGVSYCATCDGPLFADREVAVVGGGNSALQASLELSAVAKKVYLVMRGEYSSRADAVMIEKLKKADNIMEMSGFESKAIFGDQVVQKFAVSHLESGETQELKVDGVFVEIGLIPNTAFVQGAVQLNESEEIIVDCRCNTNIPGLFAAGDVTDGPDKQIVIAAGDGARAALVAYEYLLHQK